MSEPEKVEGIVLILGPSRISLNERQLIAYIGHRKKYIIRMLPVVTIMGDHQCAACGDPAIRHEPETDEWLCGKHSRERFSERHE